MNDPLCSIIIPTYNHGNFIERSVSSALAQTYPNKEVIVVDDGSTDDTRERLKKLLPEITYHLKENGGLGAARNTGIQLSKGKYLQFLDADDTLEKDKLSAQIKILEENENCSLVYSDCRNTDFNGNESTSISYPLAEDEDPIPILLQRTLTNLDACVVRRSAAVAIGMFDECRYAQEDWDFWLRLALRGFRIKYDPGDFAHYDQTGSVMTSDSELMYRRTKHMLERYENDEDFNRLCKEHKARFVASQNIQLATRAYNNRWWSTARSHFFRAASQGARWMSAKYWVCIPKTYVHEMLDRIRGNQSGAPIN